MTHHTAQLTCIINYYEDASVITNWHSRIMLFIVSPTAFAQHIGWWIKPEPYALAVVG